jgi:iron complex outermembrane receptor protein
MDLRDSKDRLRGPLGTFRTASLLVVLLAGLAAPGRAQDQIAAASDLKSMSIEELMEIDVTSVSRRSESLSRAAAAITVITAEDIRRSGINSLPEALRLVNGLHVAQQTQRLWSISARGFNQGTANKLLVLVDGRSVYSPLFSGVYWDVQDVLLEDVERIEVIRGPGATLWGANAVNGVINIITRKAEATQGGLAVAGGGNEERGFAGGRWGGTLGERGHYRVYGKYRSVDALAFADGRDAIDDMWLGKGGFRADWKAAEGDADYTVQGDVYTGRVGEERRGDQDVDGGHLLGRWSHRTSERSGLELQVYWDRYHRFIPTLFEEHRDTWDVGFQQDLHFGERHNVVWGLGYRHTRDEVGSSPEIAFLPARRAQDLFSAFAQDEISLLGDRLRVTLGTKLEHNDSTGLEVQPNARFSLALSDRRTVWGAASRAVRTPTRLDEDIVFYIPATGQELIRGSRDFESEELIAYELGYRTRLRADMSFDLATFYNVYDDVRSQERQPGGGLPIVLRNRANAETWGIETRLNGQPVAWWRWHFASALLEERFSLDAGSTDPTGGRAEGNDPRHRLLLRSYLDLPGGVELDTILRYVDQLSSSPVPSYLEMDLHLGWRPLSSLELALVGRNLLHDGHPELGGNPALWEEVERSIYGKATWSF